MYTLIFMFKPGIKVARLDPRSHLVHPSVPGRISCPSAVSGWYFSDFSQSACGGDPKVFFRKSICPGAEPPARGNPSQCPPQLPFLWGEPSTCDSKHRQRDLTAFLCAAPFERTFKSYLQLPGNTYRSTRWVGSCAFRVGYQVFLTSTPMCEPYPTVAHVFFVRKLK